MDKGRIGQIDVLLYDAPCFFSEGTFHLHDPSAAGSLFVTVADSSTFTECQPGSPGLYRGVIFRCILRRHSQVHSSAAIQISVKCAGPQQVPCLYVAPFLSRHSVKVLDIRFMRLPENVKVPSEKNQGASYDNTSICPIIPPWVCGID